MGKEVPVFLGHERLNFAFSVHDKPKRNGLHPARAQIALDFLTKHGRHLVADKPVEHAPRLLCVHQILIDGARVFKRGLHGVFAYFVKFDAHGRVGGNIEQSCNVPRNCLAFAVGVGCEQHRFCGARRFFKAFGNAFFVVHNDVCRLEIVFYVHRQAFGRQVADVPARCENFISAAEVFLHGFELTETLYNNKFHRISPFLRYAIQIFSFFVNQSVDYERGQRRVQFRGGQSARFGQAVERPFAR